MMPVHPAVKMERLQELPMSIRVVAIKASRPDRTFGDFERIVNLLNSNMVSSSEALAFLPVIYANLDPKLIPTGEQTYPDDNTQCAELAVDALWNLVNSTRIPKNLCLTLWSHLWPWSIFLHTHFDDRPELVGSSKQDFEVNFILLAHALQARNATRTEILASPGFKRVLVSIWGSLQLLLEREDIMDIVSAVFAFIPHLDLRDPATVEEVIDGAGGDLEDLAYMISRFTYSLANEELLEPSHMRVILAFITDYDQFDEETNHWLSEPLGPLSDELRRNWFMSPLMITMIQFSTALSVSSELQKKILPVLVDCFMLLERFLYSSGSFWLVKAIEYGLLRVIAICGPIRFSCCMVPNQLRWFIVNSIPPFLHNYYIVKALKSALSDVKELVETDAFKQCDTFPIWSHLMHLMDPRLALLAEVDSPELLCKKACDNIRCGYIGEKSLLKRCMDCTAAYYCSRTCQVEDWKEGGHEKVCRSYHTHSLILRPNADPHLRVRERSFLRAVVQADYETLKPTISAKQLQFMIKDSACKLMITLFDYCASELDVRVVSATDSELATELSQWGAEWTHMFERALRSEGTTHIHIVQVLQSQVSSRYWAIPLRTSSSMLSVRLRELATSGVYSEEQPASELVAAVQTILKECRNVVETH